ncbi:hypothetical protein DSO57_1022002 [Entomophthora muscae]|uniref:Uncharacterized protein n=1 Tax=Entomophthora muscae TaxID=34485 RepID=A0ACC2U1N2_9FUNG|nr:hypothetical protein DSO57_1022002 [Entomophthora muscae]
MPRNHYLLAGIIYFCSNLIILFASICESSTQYKLAYLYPPGYTPATSVNLPRALDLEYFYPHHLDLPSGCAKETILPAIKENPTTPLPNAPPAQDFSKLGFVYITVLGLVDQVVPHTGSWRPLATTVNYLVRITSIMYMAFQARPASPVGVQPDSGMSRDRQHVKIKKYGILRAAIPKLTNPGIEPATVAAKQKHGQPRKPAGGFEPPTNHQGGWEPTLKREIGLNLLSIMKHSKMTRASLQTGPGGLAALNSSRATSSNATNELGGSHQLVNDFCWVIQQIQYQLGLLNNLKSKSVPVLTNSASLSKFKVPSPVSFPSPDSLANLQPTSKNNATSPTDVMKHHLLEDVPVFPSNQKNPAKEDPKAFETLTMPAVFNHFIRSRSYEQPLNQEYSPVVKNSPAQKQV